MILDTEAARKIRRLNDEIVAYSCRLMSNPELDHDQVQESLYVLDVFARRVKEVEEKLRGHGNSEPMHN